MARRFSYTAIGIELLYGFLRLLTGRRKQLTAKQKQQLQTHWSQVQTITEPTKQILEAEKVFTSAWRYRGVQGSFADQWKRVGGSYSNEQAVWNAHKLRNRIVHQPNAEATKKDAQLVLKEYGHVLQPMFK